eukprot:g7599.t1
MKQPQQRPSTKNPLLQSKEEKAREGLRLKREIKAAVRLQRFWKDAKVRLKWKRTVLLIKDSKKKKFANGVLVIMFLSQLVSILVHAYTQYEPMNAVFLFNAYLFLLVWAATVPLKIGNWQLKIGVALPFLERILECIVRIDESTFYLIGLLDVVGVIAAPFMLQPINKALQYNYSTDLHGLATRLSTKIIAGLPVACYLAMTIIQCQISEEIIKNELCPYVPGAYHDKDYMERRRVAKGGWMNCTDSREFIDSEQFDKHYPELPHTVNEMKIEEGMEEYVANELKLETSSYQLFEMVLLIMTSQVLLRLCRLTMNDILNVNVSKWELGLTVVTVIRIAAVFVYGGLSLKVISMSQYRTVQTTFNYCLVVLWLITILLVIKLVRDASAVIDLEKPRRKKKAFKHSASIEMIHKRSRRFSSMEGNENSSFGVGDDIV